MKKILPVLMVSGMLSSYIEGNPRTYDASFAAVKGARTLWLDSTVFGKID